ncbi:hypothetical protein AXF42_Ash010229 [Apostasia shenzhenica]|uniref:Uncharacterized protein n=1 Tax=Apostasia shenzhenica TaxID=1088818 RepID=A0A2I0A9U4_9ASPA|nr:hypothetical protein AXF42_Ash010229 [Apostasia shenzhenica]
MTKKTEQFNTPTETPIRVSESIHCFLGLRASQVPSQPDSASRLAESSGRVSRLGVATRRVEWQRQPTRRLDSASRVPESARLGPDSASRVAESARLGDATRRVDCRVSPTRRVEWPSQPDSASLVAESARLGVVTRRAEWPSQPDSVTRLARLGLLAESRAESGNISELRFAQNLNKSHAPRWGILGGV